MPKIPKRQQDNGIQRLWMDKLFPHFKYIRGKGKSYWIGTLQPTEISPVYKVKIELSRDKSPRITVLEPDIEPNIHQYSDRSLCLYYPKDPKELKWTQESIIAKTIIPWTAAWLYFYEYWLETDKWFNEEAPHDDLKRRN